MVPVNYWAVIASALIMMVLGALWYGPLFGKQWASLMGLKIPEKIGDKERNAMMRSYALMALGSLVMSFVLAHAVIFAESYLGMSGAVAGGEIGLLNWLGFVTPITLSTVLWEGKPWKLWFINVGYYFVGMLVVGVLLSIWQ
ncbi:MAG TPA: DUF1761 domain-containing protein [Candidatus Paceibacterota bacterium]|nr:DUF1761 domain-containing protein [Candidatus Paceibacterota bacterium]